jgi:hypothetical protein
VTLPFKISAQAKGVQKAHANFVEEYGKREGERIFLAKAEEQGTGTTIRQKVNSIYKKGGHLGRRSG